MFGHEGWRPLTVAALVSVATFLPQGIASAAPSPRHDDPFVGPVASSREDRRPGGSVAGLKLTGWAVVSAPAETAVTAASAGTPNADDHDDGAARPAATPTVPASPGAVVSVAPIAAAPDAAAPNAAAPTVSVTAQAPAQAPVAAAAPATSTTSGSDDATRSGSSGSSDDDDPSDGSGKSSDPTSDGSSARGSSSGDSSSGGSGSAGSATTSSTGSASAAGTASCPTTSGAAAAAAPTSASGSVTAGATSTSTDVGGAASTTDVSKGVDGPLGALGTATQSTVQGVAALPGAASSVAGATGAAGSTAAGNATLPGDLIDLNSWYLTLPTGKPGTPDTIENPSLLKFTNEFFKLTPGRNGVVFSANGDGVTTKNSHYPRSELREMNGSQKASWSNTSGTHTLDVCEAFTKLPKAKPEVVGVQIHDAEDDVLQIRLEGQKLVVQYADGKSEALLDPAYQLGTPFNVKIVAAGSKVDISYNGQPKATLPLSGSGWYWKVGAYVQSNASKGDTGPTSTGEVTVYGIDMKHA